MAQSHQLLCETCSHRPLMFECPIKEDYINMLQYQPQYMCSIYLQNDAESTKQTKQTTLTLDDIFGYDYLEIT
jgi:hypothetical protein